MWTFSTRSSVFVCVVTSNGPSPAATIGALYTTFDPAILMKGLYASPAGTSEPGLKDFRGKPVDPGTASRSGVKSGAPAKWMSAGPKWFCSGLGLASVTVCTQPGQLMPMLAGFGA